MTIDPDVALLVFVEKRIEKKIKRIEILNSGNSIRSNSNPYD